MGSEVQSIDLSGFHPKKEVDPPYSAYACSYGDWGGDISFFREALGAELYVDIVILFNDHNVTHGGNGRLLAKPTVNKQG